MPDVQIVRLRTLLAHAHDHETPKGVRLTLHKLAQRLAFPQKRLILERIQQAQPKEIAKMS